MTQADSFRCGYNGVLSETALPSTFEKRLFDKFKKLLLTGLN
jgi:hypothetical protein